MANELKNLNESGYTTFGGPSSEALQYYIPSGPIGRFFAKFFAKKAQSSLVQAIDQGKVVPDTGDTVITTDVIKLTDPTEGPIAAGGVNRNIILPQQELNRKRRYKEYEEMDEYPEIGAAFDLYADDCSQKGTRSERWTVVSDNQMVVEEVEQLFSNLKLENILWDIIRNTVKYGDCFTELIVDLKSENEGIKKIKILNPTWILRVENEFGFLKKFIQQIPNDETINYSVYNDDITAQTRLIELDKNQIVHFRLHTSDPAFYPYGKSVAAMCHRTFKSLRMMEEAMTIYRLSRAPERRIFYIDIGNLPTQKAEMFIERIKQKFKKEKFYNTGQGNIDSRYNPMSIDEDYFVPTKNGKGAKIETLPGAQNLGDIEDVKYWRDKLVAALKVPKDYLVEKDKSPERKANLSQLDVKFARACQRIQTDVQAGLETIARRHLQLKKFPASDIKNLRIRLPEPSDMSAKRKLDIDEQKTRVIGAVKGLGLFSTETIYKEYYDMTDSQIEEEKKRLEKDMEQQAEQAQMGGMGAAPGIPGQPGPEMAGPGFGEAGGQEPQENIPPTANENKFEKVFSRLDEKLSKTLSNIINKKKQKKQESK